MTDLDHKTSEELLAIRKKIADTKEKIQKQIALLYQLDAQVVYVLRVQHGHCTYRTLRGTGRRPDVLCQFWQGHEGDHR